MRGGPPRSTRTGPLFPYTGLFRGRGKCEGLCELGADLVGLLRFDDRMAAMSAEAFIRTVLVGRLAAREVHVGPEFRFGHRRTGDLGTLQREGAGHGFTAEAIAPVMLDGQRVSSTRIRAALQAGDFDAATRLLGASYSKIGRAHVGRASCGARVCQSV